MSTTSNSKKTLYSKGAVWTELGLQALKAEQAGLFVADGGGLKGEVRVSKEGTVSVKFLYAFRKPAGPDGSPGTISSFQCGTWPGVKISDIRKARDEARRLVAAGVNPNDHKKAARIQAAAEVQAVIDEAEKTKALEATVQDLFEDWTNPITGGRWQ